MPLISVIVPVYKVEPYLRRCVDSILAQTFSDFELILVDDGSPDGCGAICDEYAQKDSRVVVFHKENGGQATARNMGIEYVLKKGQSQWVAFVDSDDWLHPEYLQRMYQAVVNHAADIAICGHEQTAEITAFSRPIAESAPLVRNKRQLQEAKLQLGIGVAVPWNKLYHVNLLQTIRFPEQKANEDEFVGYLFLWAAETGVILEDKLYYYFQRADSAMGRPFSIKRLDGFEAFLQQLDFYKDNQFTEVARKQSLQMEGNLAKIIKKYAGDKLIRKKCRKLYWQLLMKSRKLWSKKFWCQRLLFAISPNLMYTLHRVYHLKAQK